MYMYILLIALVDANVLRSAQSVHLNNTYFYILTSPNNIIIIAGTVAVYLG